MKVKKIIPISLISATALAAVSAIVPLSLSAAKKIDNSNEILINSGQGRLYFGNLHSIDEVNEQNLVSTIEASGLLQINGNNKGDDYIESAKITNLNSYSTTARAANSCAKLDLEIKLKDGYKFNDGSSTITFKNLTTGINHQTKLTNINSDKLASYCLKWNNIDSVLNQTDLINLVVSNTSLLSTQIKNVFIEPSNDISNGSFLTLNFKICLNDGYISNDLSSIININVPTKIDVEQLNATDYFNINEKGTITGLKADVSLGNSIFIPSTYNFIDSKGNSQIRPITSIQSLGTTANTSVQFVYLPKSITLLGDNLFRGWTSLKMINIPENIQSTSQNIFYDCTSLKSISLPENVKSISGGSFINCTSLENITLSSNLNMINGWAFQNCSNLSSIIIPNNVTSIRDGTFYGCNKLTYIHLPYGLRSIGDEAFRYCNSLININIPNNVTSIGTNVFNGCTKLSNVVLGTSLNSIGQYAFNGDNKLKNLIIPPSVTSFGQYSLQNLNSNTNIFIQGNYTNSSIFSNTFYTSSPNVYVINDLTKNAIISATGNNVANSGGTVKVNIDSNIVNTNYIINKLFQN